MRGVDKKRRAFVKKLSFCELRPLPPHREAIYSLNAGTYHPDSAAVADRDCVAVGLVGVVRPVDPVVY